MTKLASYLLKCDTIKYKSSMVDNGFCYVILDKSPMEFLDKGEVILDW